jgi:hypothetical protein
MRKPVGRPTAKSEESWLKEVHNTEGEDMVEGGGGEGAGVRTLMP